MKILFGDPPRELDAEFDLNFAGGQVSLLIHARGGAISKGTQINPDYEHLVQSLLERLKSANASLSDVLLASKTVANLPASDRRIALESFDYPVHMRSVQDVTELRLAIRRGVVRAHSSSENKTHGNATKRIELVATGTTADLLAAFDDGFQDVGQDDTDGAGETFIEGRKRLRIHLYRERNQSLVRRAKDHFKALHSRLFCEVCGFDFRVRYGDIGENYIEAHHEDPIGSSDEERKTRIDDLRMVCANCHRILHRTFMGESVTVAQLRQIVDQTLSGR